MRENERRKAELLTNLNEVKRTLPTNVNLVVVTKTFPISDIEILYELGERQFGENREDEGSGKSKAMPEDVIWHFQGRIQSKKIKSLVNWCDVIHSLDDLGHAKKIQETAAILSKLQDVFIQINLDGDLRSENRSGINEAELMNFTEAISHLNSLRVLGVMGIAPLNQDPRPGFEFLAESSMRLRSVMPEATNISAGMSSDYQIALKYGATHLRIGSSILGSRNYQA
jgi:pyridoxal phosphate enzyme (YggS family)